MTWKAAVASVGLLVVVAGIALLPLPGPGWLIIFAGLAILATEFSWARRVLNLARAQVARWTSWLRGQSIAVRGGVAVGGVLLVCGAAWLALTLMGTPAWVPVTVADTLRIPPPE